MNKKLIIGNWKMNPNTLREAEHLFKEFKKITTSSKNINTILCVPYVFLFPLKKLKITTKFSLGAQDVFFEQNGSFTGEVSPSMIYEAGARYTIVGHSERRYKVANENDEDVNKKIKILLKNKIIPIVCIGEKVRDQKHTYFEFVKNQIKLALRDIPKTAFKNIVIAYEPLWAIGKEALRDATPVEVNEMAIFIRKCISDLSSSKIGLDVSILYGGSVSPSNINDLVEYGGVDGFLVGRASLSVKDFTKIINISDKK